MLEKVTYLENLSVIVNSHISSFGTPAMCVYKNELFPNEISMRWRYIVLPAVIQLYRSLDTDIARIALAQIQATMELKSSTIKDTFEYSIKIHCIPPVVREIANKCFNGVGNFGHISSGVNQFLLEIYGKLKKLGVNL